MSKNFIAKLLGLAAEPDAEKRAAAAADVLKAFPDDLKDGAEGAVHKGDDPMCKCADCMSKRTAKSITEDVNKAVETEVAKRVQVEVAKAVAMVCEEDEVRNILKSFTATSIDINDALPKYLALKRMAPESYESVIKTLKAQDEALSKSLAFADVGVRKGTGEGSAWAQIEAKADQLLEKSDANLTREQAIEKVMERNPKLVAQYRQESV